MEARRTRSSALFNNRYFGDVAAMALEASSFGADLITTRMVAARTGLSDSVVRPIMVRLVAADLLTKLERTAGPRSPQFYVVGDAASLARVVALVDAGAPHVR